MIPDDRRLAMALPTLDAAKMIADTTKVEAAQEQWKHLESCGTIINFRVEDIPDGKRINSTVLRIVHPSRSLPGDTTLLPILAVDESDSEAIEAVSGGLTYADAWAAFYYCTHNLIYLKADFEASSFENGITLLHETGHANRAATENRIGNTLVRNRHDEAREEADLHLMGAQLWKEKGGEGYAEVLSKAANQVGKQLNGNLVYKSLQRRDDWLEVLNKCFGATTNEVLLTHRMVSLSINAHFDYYAQKRRRDQKELRTQAMLAIHDKFWKRRDQLWAQAHK